MRSSDIHDLAQRQVLQPSLFDQRDLAEIRCEEKFPGERLVVCRNPLLAQERTRKRQDLLQATEAALEKVRAATLRDKRPLKGEQAIAVRVARVIGKYKMAKHFLCHVTQDSFSYTRNQQRIDREQALDGFYVIRTNVPAHTLSAEQTVGVYKSLSQVERAFRSYKTVDLKVRPIYHHLASRVRAIKPRNRVPHAPNSPPCSSMTPTAWRPCPTLARSSRPPLSHSMRPRQSSLGMRPLLVRRPAFRCHHQTHSHPATSPSMRPRQSSLGICFPPLHPLLTAGKCRRVASAQRR